MRLLSLGRKTQFGRETANFSFHTRVLGAHWTDEDCVRLQVRVACHGDYTEHVEQHRVTRGFSGEEERMEEEEGDA